MLPPWPPSLPYLRCCRPGPSPLAEMRPSWTPLPSAQMLLDTLKWRSEYRPEALDYEAIKVGCNVASSS